MNIFIISVILASIINYLTIKMVSKKCDIYSYYFKDNKLNLIYFLPVFNLLIKCKKSRVKVLLINIVTILSISFIFYKFKMSIYFFYYIVFFTILMLVILIDMDTYTIPNKIILFGIIFSVSFNLFYGNIFESIFGGLVSFFNIFSIVILVEKFIKKEAMGRGDIKLFSMIGLFFGYEKTFIVINLSMHTCLFYFFITNMISFINKKDYKTILPFGPFISISSILVMFLSFNNISIM